MIVITDETLDQMDDEQLEALFGVIYADVDLDERYTITEEGQQWATK